LCIESSLLFIQVGDDKINIYADAFIGAVCSWKTGIETRNQIYREFFNKLTFCFAIREWEEHNLIEIAWVYWEAFLSVIQKL
jgi:hypothetical protein